MDRLSVEQIQAYKAVFKSFDRDGDETIDVSELGAAMRNLGRDVSPEEIQQMIATVDKDGTGSINFEEFVSLLVALQEQEEEAESEGDGDEIDGVNGDNKPDGETFISQQAILYHDKTNQELQDMIDRLGAARATLMGLIEKDENAFLESFRTVAWEQFRLLHEKEVLLKVDPPFPEVEPEPPTPPPPGSKLPPPPAPPSPAEYRAMVLGLLKAVDEDLRICNASVRTIEPEYVEVYDISDVNSTEANSETYMRHTLTDDQIKGRLHELEHFEFEKEVDSETLFGEACFRAKVREFPFYMFPVETVCKQLEALEELHRSIKEEKGVETLPPCPKGDLCTEVARPDHRIKYTHPCFSEERPCPHMTRSIHTKCFVHGPAGRHAPVRRQSTEGLPATTTTSSTSSSSSTTKAERLKLLGVLRLNAFDIGDNGCMALSEVIFRDSKRPDEGIIRELYMQRNSIGPAGAIYLLEAGSHLTLIDLSHNLLGYKGAQLRGLGVGRDLKRILQRNSKLITLILSHNRLGDYDVKFIAEGLSNNTTLKKLDLGNNEMGPQSGIRLAAAIADNRTLQELHVGWNLLEGPGTKALLQELKQNNILQVIDLSWTGIRDENGGADIGELLSCSALRWLNVSNNDLGIQSGLAIAKGILDSPNKNLTYLNMAYNPLGDKAILEILKSLRENISLEQIDLRCTGGSDECTREVKLCTIAREQKMGKRNDVAIHFSTSMIAHSDKLESDKWT